MRHKFRFREKGKNNHWRTLAGAGLSLCMIASATPATVAAEQKENKTWGAGPIYLMGDQGPGRGPIHELTPSTGKVKTHIIGSLPGTIEALGWHSQEEKLYIAYHRFIMRVHSPNSSDWDSLIVEGLPDKTKWSYGSISPDGKDFIVGDPQGTTYQIDMSNPNAYRAKALPQTETKPWAGWVHHPHDNRIYTVDNSTGDLVVIDPERTPTNRVVKPQALPTKEYRSLFFDKAGGLHAIDKNGMLTYVDLTNSTSTNIIEDNDIPSAESIPQPTMQIQGLPYHGSAGYAEPFYTSHHTKYRDAAYLAVGEKNTQIYEFNPQTGSTLPTGIKYEPGFKAMGWRQHDEKIYAAEKDNVLIINPAHNKIETKKVKGLPEKTWINGEVTRDGKYLMVAENPSVPVYHIDLNTFDATAMNPPGTGGWYDWAYHPIDNQLYATDGRTGELLRMNTSATPMKETVKNNALPTSKPEGNSTYSANFFDREGNLYAIDTAGNVNRLDLTQSSAEKPVTGEQIPASTHIGGRPLDIAALTVVNAAGIVKEIAEDPLYEVNLSATLDGQKEVVAGKKNTYTATITNHSATHSAQAAQLSIESTDFKDLAIEGCESESTGACGAVLPNEPNRVTQVLDLPVGASATIRVSASALEMGNNKTLTARAHTPGVHNVSTNPTATHTVRVGMYKELGVKHELVREPWQESMQWVYSYLFTLQDDVPQQWRIRFEVPAGVTLKKESLGVGGWLNVVQDGSDGVVEIRTANTASPPDSWDKKIALQLSSADKHPDDAVVTNVTAGHLVFPE